MNQTKISPDSVVQTLKKHILADGMDIVLDLEKSKGVYAYDSKKQRKLLDFFTCFASLPVGYNHPRFFNDEKFKNDLLKAAIVNPSNSDIYTEQYAHFVETFSRIGIPSYLPHAFFIAGGALAIENALKVAMDWKVQKNFEKGYKTEKGHKVLHFEDAFHGRSGYTMSLTNTQPNKTKWFAKFDWPRVSNPMIKFPYSDNNHDDLVKREELCFNQIKTAFQENKDEICAIIIEPIQSEGGDHHFRKEFLEKLRILSDENECLLIYDEVQTGVGITGKFWCHEHFGENARPDIMAFGKKMQICGILAGKKVDEVPGNVFNVSSRINSTWGGNLVDMVRSAKVLEIIEEESLVENAESVGSYLLDKLLHLGESFSGVSNVRGRGMLCAFDLPDGKSRDNFIQEGMAMDTLFLGCGNKSIRFRPTLITSREDIDKGIEVATKILT